MRLAFQPIRLPNWSAGRPLQDEARPLFLAFRDTPSFFELHSCVRLQIVCRCSSDLLLTVSARIDAQKSQIAMSIAGGIDQSLSWTFGLINSSGKYLTAESFQHKITANGTTLKKKQIWTLVRIGGNTVALKNHAGTYLSIDKDGNVSGAGDEIGGDQKLTLETNKDGKVSIKSSYGRYLGGSGDNISGFDKTCDETNYYTIHLAMHPQINLYNVNRRTFCHLVEDEIRCNEEIPWGFDALIILEFHDGKYALRAANGKLLDRRGKLVDQINADSTYTLVFSEAQVAFRDRSGKYLTAVGSMATVQARRDTIGKDELFVLMDSHPQMSLTASNGKLVAIRDTVEVRANQSEVTDKEIFQMEAIDRSDKSGNCKWAFRSSNKKYWSASPGLKADKESISEAAQFEVVWQGPMIALKSVQSGKYISVKSNGKMSADSAELTDDCKFVFDFINRPLLVLRGSYGFVGVKGNSGMLECNRSHYDVFHVTCKNGSFNIQGANGKFMGTDGSGCMTVCSDTPVDFFFELRAHTHMAILAPNGKYLQGSQNGGFAANGGGISNSTLWEY